MIKTKTKRTFKRSLRQIAAILLSFFGIFLLFCSVQNTTVFSPLEQITSKAQQSLTAFSQQTIGEKSSQRIPFWQRLFLSESPCLKSFENQSQSQSPSISHSNSTEIKTEQDKQLHSVETDSKIVSRTLSSGDTMNYFAIGNAYLSNHTKKNLDFSNFAVQPAILNTTNDAPKILIMHTHTTESYHPDETDSYRETDTARTTDPNYNITRVGAEIARIFSEMGLSTLHDTTLHDYPNFNGSYERSRTTVEQYLEEYPSIQVVLDIHRDALVGQDGTIYKPVVTIDDKEAAQVLLVVGTDDNGAYHPNWETNLALAVAIQEQTNTLWPNLARPIALRSNRFNQEITSGSILVEIGSHGNTLQEALYSARLFARSAGQVLLSLQT